MALTEQKVNKVYSALKVKATEYMSQGDIHKALLYTHLAAYTNNTFFLSFYDEELESIVKSVGNRLKLTDVKREDLDQNRCIFIDSLARYRGGLTVQYVKAIAAAGWQMLYLTEQEMDSPQRKELKALLTSLSNVTIVETPHKLKGVEKLQYMYDTILQFKPYRVYKHLNSYDAYLSALCYALPSAMTKYTLDIADHAFLLGYQSGDYSFEFRELGCSIAAKFRGQPKDRMLLLPFYPVIDDVPFNGLPPQCEGKKLILSGGRYWKAIDNEDTYFKLVRGIIDNTPDAVVLFPGSGDDTVIREKIAKYNLEDSFFLIGWRDDMSELFRRSDAFLNTYPHGGGTMNQYAAHLKTPILSYRPEGYCANPVECFVCQDGYTEISSIGEEAFLEESDKIIHNKEYATKKAAQTYDVILGIEKFNDYFKQMSGTMINIIPFELDDSVQLSEEQRKKKLEYNNKTGEYQMRLVALTGINSITCNYEFLSVFIRRIGPKLKRVFQERGFHFNRI